MKAEQKYFEDCANHNFWLYELSDAERDHIEFMLKDYLESQLKEEREQYNYLLKKYNNLLNTTYNPK